MPCRPGSRCGIWQPGASDSKPADSKPVTSSEKHLLAGAGDVSSSEAVLCVDVAREVLELLEVIAQA